ncbi:MAG TPA: radical SAM protein [Saprospiraceae bacterium]|nr:radical SAM protein [Saprospiraceae bacterium]
MESVDFWKILRVLTTNACNYKCVFCHNEGQAKYDGSYSDFLKFDDFKFIIQSLQETGLREIQFSGGEPFMNPETIQMIVWANDNTDLEIGCATNTQFFDDNVINILAQTRIKLQIQFPSSNQRKFESITKTKLFEPLLNNLKKLKQAKVQFSLNYVLLTPNISDFQQILPFLYDNEIGLKLLPYVNDKTLKNNEFRKFIIPFLVNISFKYENQNNGSLKWWLYTPNGKVIAIKYIDSPCFEYEFDKCKNYAEVRLLPDLAVQSCLINPVDNLKIDFELCEENQSQVRQIFQKAWKSFTHC